MEKYAVIGNPIEHSKSPQIHTAFAQQEGIDIDYQRILAKKDELLATVNDFIQSGGLGLNVTVPFKIEAYENCHQLNQYAKAAKAVNTLSFNENTGWVGANTDGLGLLRDLKNNLRIQIANKNVLILGAGGATRGILLPLLEEKPKNLLIANRTIDKALALAEEFKDQTTLSGCGFEELGSEKFDIVINATSASLSNELPPLPNNIVNVNGICYDLAYSDNPTPFLIWAKQQGITKSQDGLGMLIEQAAESYFIWRGFRPQTKSVFKLLRS